MGGRVREWLAVALGLVCAGAGASPGTAAGEDASWMPLDPGRTWTYVYARDNVRITADGSAERDRFRGTLRDRVRGPAPEFGARVVEVISTLRGRSADPPIESTETRRAFLEPAGLGYRIHALDTEHPIVGTSRLTRYDPPLAQLTVGPGSPPEWSIGTVDVGGLTTRLEAEIVGVQDADTPSGRYRGCLVVRYGGDLRGSLEVYGGHVEVTGGRVSVTEWFARGIGLVLAKEDVEQRIRMPDGRETTVLEHVEYALSALGETGEAAPAAR